MQFMNSKKAQQIINDNLDKPYAPPPSRNPVYDLREEGQDFYPLNPPVTPVVDDPCPEGYQLIDGVCQPIEQFNPEINYADQNDDGKSFLEERAEERPYFDIEGMAELSDDELASIENHVKTLTAAIASQDKDQIQNAQDALNEFTKPFAERMMDDTISTALKGKSIE